MMDTENGLVLKMMTTIVLTNSINVVPSLMISSPPLKKRYKMKEKDSFALYLALMFSGGFMGAYSYILKGGVFANAETANCLQLGYNLALGNMARVWLLFGLVITYFIGSFVSEVCLEYFKDHNITISWQAIATYFSVLLLIVVGLLPTTAPDVYTHVIITYTSATLYNTFRKSGGLAMSTVFCTAHLREAGVNAAKALVSKDKRHAKASLKHALMVASFIFGTYISALCISALLERAIFVNVALNLVIAILLTLRDLKQR